MLAIIDITEFSIGEYPAFGCFFDGDTVYFGRGGTTQDMSDPLSKAWGRRVWCKAISSQQPQIIEASTGSESQIEDDIIIDTLPTAEPEPTAGPSALSLASFPSYVPKKTPLKAPTSRPSLQPTTMPAKIPTTQPITRMPSKAPSSKPTKEPTNTPTSQPSKRPSKRPSSRPSSDETNSTGESGTACLTQLECNQRRQKLGYETYYVGNYATKGCFSKGTTAYFGLGGDVSQISVSLSGNSFGRIRCDSNLTQLTTTLPPLALSTTPPENEYCIDIKIVTDKFGGETGFSLTSNPTDGTSSKRLMNKNIGSLDSETVYSRRTCVPAGSYTFTVRDENGGLCCRDGSGSYSVSIDGDEVVSGGRFSTTTLTHKILAGYDPQMSNRDKEWLDGHNSRRQDFHKLHNTEYRPLHWSPELAKDASDEVDQMLPVCKHISGEGGYGENSAVRRHRELSDGENPDDILNLWSDKYLRQDTEHLDNKTMTQVMWRATRHVGCADKFIKNADGQGYCYASVCRYSRAGNCAMKQYNDWKTPTLADHTLCGKACPREGCH